jgi:hypothetical protein
VPNGERLFRWLFSFGVCVAVSIFLYYGCRSVIFQAADGTPLEAETTIPCDQCGFVANWVDGKLYTYQCRRCGHVKRAKMKRKPIGQLRVRSNSQPKCADE